VAAQQAHAGVPGELEAARIESVYFERGAHWALEALMDDFRSAFGAGTDAGRRQIEDEVSRLEAHTARYSQYSPLVAIATQWCLERHAPSEFPLAYENLLPASDADPGAAPPDIALDREMVNVLQIHWTSYANLTRSQLRGYVLDEHEVGLALSDLIKDQADQEDVRKAANSLSGATRATSR
jgi:hypothetical protein